MSYSTRSPAATSARRPSCSSTARPDTCKATPTCASACGDRAIRPAVRDTRVASASIVDTRTYPSRCDARRPSNGRPANGTTSTGTSVRDIASPKNSAFLSSGTEAVVTSKFT